jgi:hypothetical protein
MEQHQGGETRKVKRFQELFPKVMKAVVDTLGEKPFHIRGPLNAAVLDSVLTVALENPGRIDKAFAQAYTDLIANEDFLTFTQLGTTDTATLRDRYKLAQKSLVG